MKLQFASALVAAVGLLLLVDASSQTYPTKPLRMVAPEPGGGTELQAKLVAQGLTTNLGQQVIVESRPGGGGAIAAEYVAKSPPDGYTLLFYGTNIWVLPLLRDKVPYDPLKDFAPITLAARAPNILVVHPSLPVNSVKDLVALAKDKPGELNYGSAGSGSSTHIAAELFKVSSRTNITRIPYKRTGAALVDLVGGRIHMMFCTATSALTYVRGGKLKALAVTTAKPFSLFPGLPTIGEAGLPGYESSAVTGVWAPAGTRPEMVSRLNKEFNEVLANAELRQKLLASGVEAVGGSPDHLASTMRSEMIKMRKLIKDARISED